MKWIKLIGSYFLPKILKQILVQNKNRKEEETKTTAASGKQEKKTMQILWLGHPLIRLQRRIISVSTEIFATKFSCVFH
jgi:hypothetical protein